MWKLSLVGITLSMCLAGFGCEPSDTVEGEDDVCGQAIQCKASNQCDVGDFCSNGCCAAWAQCVPGGGAVGQFCDEESGDYISAAEKCDLVGCECFVVDGVGQIPAAASAIPKVVLAPGGTRSIQVFVAQKSGPAVPGANVSLGDSSEVKLGDKVFTIGFPMSNILGQQPRYSEGVINSLAGVGDDPKAFQISIPIQSGNSGGPLFNQKGEVVGIVSSSLDSANTFQIFGNAPQNVNFAIKSTFVKNLLPMIPEMLVSPTDIVVVPKDSGSLSGFIERVQNNIVLIEAEY